jgi:hypothetical protein
MKRVWLTVFTVYGEDLFELECLCKVDIPLRID